MFEQTQAKMVSKYILYSKADLNRIWFLKDKRLDQKTEIRNIWKWYMFRNIVYQSTIKGNLETKHLLIMFLIVFFLSLVFFLFLKI